MSFNALKITNLVVLCCILIGVVSCTSAPRSSGYPYTLSQDMQSVHHWQTLANKVVLEQIMPGVPPSKHSNYITVPDYVYVDESDPTIFGKTFRDYLITELFNYGVRPVGKGQANVEIRWGTRLVEHPKIKYEFPGLFMGTFEVLGTAFVGSSLAKSPSKIEVVVITQVEKDGHIASRQAHNFYISEAAMMNFYNPVKAGLQGAWSMLRASVAEADFKGQEQALAEIDDAMNWQTTQDLKHMPKKLLSIRKRCLRGRAPQAVMTRLDEVDEVLQDVLSN